MAALCWGSFLNMLACRLMGDVPFNKPRSECPHCHTTLAWYDLIPVLSYLMLRGTCRYCSRRISWLYPCIELITLCAVLILLSVVPVAYLAGAFIFTSALIVTFRTDAEHMLISRYMTLYLIPFFVWAAWYGITPMTLYASIVGAVSAYAALWMVREVHYRITHKVGMGQGDLELLAMIGSYLGVQGWWMTVLIGSLIGSIVGIACACYYKTMFIKLPFGVFLAIGAFVTLIIFAQPQLFYPTTCPT
jgi:leader peptidase (prepilin peptidase)/N-methyltransferase